RLAGAGLADDAERLALGNRDIDVLHRLDDAAPGGEFDGEVVDIEKRLGRHDDLRKNLENNPMQSRMARTPVVFPPVMRRRRPAKLESAIMSSAAGRRCRAGRRRAN